VIETSLAASQKISIAQGPANGRPAGVKGTSAIGWLRLQTVAASDLLLYTSRSLVHLGKAPRRLLPAERTQIVLCLSIDLVDAEAHRL